MIFSKFLNATNWHKRPYTEILDEVREITDYLIYAKRRVLDFDDGGFTIGALGT